MPDDGVHMEILQPQSRRLPYNWKIIWVGGKIGKGDRKGTKAERISGNAWWGHDAKHQALRQLQRSS